MTWRMGNPRSDHVAPEEDPLATDTDRIARDRDQLVAEEDREQLAAEEDHEQLAAERHHEQLAAERQHEQLAAENDPIVRHDAQLLPPDEDEMTQGGHPVMTAHDELTPDHDLVIMTEDLEQAPDDDQARTTGDHMVHEDHVVHDDRLMPGEGTARQDDQPATGAAPDADSPARVFAVPAAAAEPAPDADIGPAAADIGPAPDADIEAAAAADTRRTSFGVRWHEILAMFVDDPRTSVELAAGLVDDSTEALVASLRERQQVLLSAWQGNDADTEELRTALQQYRAFWNRLEDFSQ